MGLTKLVVRVLALVGKEIIEVFRRPGVVVSLVLGPFLILAVFGFGYQGYKRDLRTVVVISAGSTLPNDLASYQALDTRGLEIVGVESDRSVAEARLRSGDIDVVIVPPTDPVAAIESGKQADITVLTNVTDPVTAAATSFLADTMAAAVNREIYRMGAQEGQAYALRIGDKALSDIPADVVAAPTRAVVENLAPVPPTIVGFYGPAALALVLQHMAVTLIALSIVRERASGALDRFRSSPMRATEVVLGKVLAFGLLGIAIAALSVWLMVSLLGVPMLGSAGLVAVVIGLLLVASLGLGLLISVISDSERQAVQLSLLTLLASMFFSGFVIGIDQFQAPVRAISYALPVTHGISLLQDVMLTGSIGHVWQLGALAAIGGVLLLISWRLLRRELRPA